MYQNIITIIISSVVTHTLNSFNSAYWNFVYFNTTSTGYACQNKYNTTQCMYELVLMAIFFKIIVSLFLLLNKRRCYVGKLM